MSRRAGQALCIRMRQYQSVFAHPWRAMQLGPSERAIVSCGKLAEDLLPYLSRQERELASANLLLFLSSLQARERRLHAVLKNAVSRLVDAASVLD